MGDTIVDALKGINFSVEQGEFIAITGASGSGKSTLMHILGCLDIPTSGDYLLAGENITNADNNQLAAIRNKKIGFVFQKFYLLPDLTALDNVSLPQLYAGATESTAHKKAAELLDIVGLGDRKGHYPYQLSGGQQQRVAIARALANDPSIILADEPTGNLDSATGQTIMKLLQELNQQKKVTIIIVTHEPDIAHQTNRIVELTDGLIVSDKKINPKSP